jgi:hypothetical protein
MLTKRQAPMSCSLLMGPPSAAWTNDAEHRTTSTLSACAQLESRIEDLPRRPARRRDLKA